jgi:hypothetical protein
MAHTASHSGCKHLLKGGNKMRLIKKSDFVKEIIVLVNNLDVDKIYQSEHRMFYVVNKPYFIRFKDTNFLMKLCKENLLEIISILERYQKEETK